MLRFALAVLAVSLVGLVGGACAQESAAERAFWVGAFQTGRSYAVDMTLLAYCFRKDEDTAARLPLSVVSDLNEIFVRAQTGAYSARRAGEFVRQVLTAVRFAERDSNDPQLEQACLDRHVLEDYFKLAPIAWPLSLRPPFAKS